MKSVDARGLLCPQPLIETKKMIDSLQEVSDVEVLVDNENAACNVVDYLKGLGIESARNGFTISFRTGVLENSSAAPISCNLSASNASWAVVINSLTMGKGSDELGAILLKAFINTLPQTGDLPSYIVMYNEGVKCATANAGVLDTLKKLEDEGVSIIVCGTCVEYFAIREEIEVGVISNMLKIIEVKESVSKLVYL